MTKAKKDCAPVTIYSTGPIGAIVKTEGYLESATDHTIKFYTKKSRSRLSSIMSWHAPFRCIVSGWGHAAAQDAFNSAKISAEGADVYRARHTGASVSWCQEWSAQVAPTLGDKITHIWSK